MKIQLDVQGMSQYSKDVFPQFQNSACGPTTICVILNYHASKQSRGVNELYRMLGGTRIGLFTWRLIKNLRKLLGSGWDVSRCSLAESLKELEAGRPVAMKFDKHFTFQWFSKPTFKYHWVPLIGYEIKDDELYLLLHDNGGRNRESQIRKIRYSDNYKVLTFVKIKPR
ncbi:C39 family peptidase [Ureibacillus aquaedulcis]|uniref:C39 family peptidase n=1 Tax=Ureibacillus aquaedulcis TaxID=3058421 RepID=A0ABT8GNE8_9BACL|nr:C39 family peptidase [Ureibacillus sp. BA0131]MDN4492945.1 C39 family peptidase [Ureibacillus sp. BA0131]